MKVVQVLDSLKSRSHIPYTQLCQCSGVPYSSFMRWKGRLGRNKPVIKTPGPKKVRMPDMGRLQAEIKGLQHRVRRSLGSGVLYRKYQEEISRREFQELVNLSRKEVNREIRHRMRQITWHTAGLVWSMDDTLTARDMNERKLYLHNMSDMGSKYVFSPRSNRGGVLPGEEVAKILEQRFKAYAPPLFMKRDNGGNLNHTAVNNVLSKYLVIPLNSPKHYPPYNGSLEHLNGEIKEYLERKLHPRPFVTAWSLEDMACIGANEVNHYPRRVLSGRSACSVFSQRKGGGGYSKRQRESIFNLISGITGDILKYMGNVDEQAIDSVWRMVVENWLQQQGHITVSMNRKVLPYFSRILSHN